MALLLDTTTLPARERAAAFHAALEGASAPTSVKHGTQAHDVATRMHFTALAGPRVFSADSTPFSLHRTSRHLRLSSPDIVNLTLQRSGEASYAHEWSSGRKVTAGQVFLVDLTSVHEYHLLRSGDVLSYQLDLHVAGVAVEDVRRAAPRLEHSPLLSMVRHQLSGLEAAAEAVEGTAAATLLGESMTALFRALLASVAAADPRPALAEVLFERIRWYVHQNLSDPGLCAAQVAAAHHISVRHLYAVLAEHGIALRPWLFEQRLVGARDELTGPGSRSITAIALRWGFTDPGHFSRRFRRAYGCTPSEWRAACRAQRQSPLRPQL